MRKLTPEEKIKSDARKKERNLRTARKWQKDHPEQTRKNDLRYLQNLRDKDLGKLTRQEYNVLLASQGGRCSTCERTKPNGSRADFYVYYDVDNNPVNLKCLQHFEDPYLPSTAPGYKICFKCNLRLEAKGFGKKKNSFDGLESWCKSCRAKYASDYQIQRRPEHTVRVAEWREENYPRYIAHAREYNSERLKTDINYRLSQRLRTRLYKALKNSDATKVGSAIEDLGCSVTELRKHLENQFYPNSETGEVMSWENHTLNGWHIEHIIPLTFYDLGEREQFLKACHYTNLRPMWGKENGSKGAKYQGQDLRFQDIRPIASMQVADMCQKYHGYKSAGLIAVYNFGVFEGEKLVAAFSWNPPPLGVGTSLCPENPQGVLALSRMVAVPKEERLCQKLSKPLKKQIKQLIDRGRWPVLVTYSDETQGHIGSVYQYSGWTKTERKLADFYLNEKGQRISAYQGGKTDTEGLAYGGKGYHQRWEHWACDKGGVDIWMTAHGWERVAIEGRVWASGNQAYKYIKIKTL